MEKENSLSDDKLKIKLFLLGILTANNIADDKSLNKEGINYICEKATNHILKHFDCKFNLVLKEVEEEILKEAREDLDKRKEFWFNNELWYEPRFTGEDIYSEIMKCQDLIRNLEDKYKTKNKCLN
jgi:hypothetical protein